jgi:hypothetical protein
MVRRALIIYCTATRSGNLAGPAQDNINYRNYLTSNLGGDWHESEIYSLENPTYESVELVRNEFLNGADYTLIIFSGHGYIRTDVGRQFLELANMDMDILSLQTTALKQFLIIDACRGEITLKEIPRSLGGIHEQLFQINSTREIFDNAVKMSQNGWVVLYSASNTQTSIDTPNGGVYLLTLLGVAEDWGKKYPELSILNINDTHNSASEYIKNNFNNKQIPYITQESIESAKSFPFAVKFNDFG